MMNFINEWIVILNTYENASHEISVLLQNQNKNISI